MSVDDCSYEYLDDVSDIDIENVGHSKSLQTHSPDTAQQSIPESKSESFAIVPVPVTRVLSKEQKRLYHNALERKRRELLNQSFIDLRNSVPSIAGKHSSRAQILVKAKEYIHIMRRKNRAYERDLEELKLYNMHLENQLLLFMNKCENNDEMIPLEELEEHNA